ncbi:MAG TPA: septal ring lytic transglycosylase RlpA family protein [Thermoanaerobaculia bacterium]|nr:septal ring lytic transglycosylase RlpA family protein [Thermoanaerobaculia bacterium]
MRKHAWIALLLLTAPLALAQQPDQPCTRQFAEPLPPHIPEPDPLDERLQKYAELEAEHRLSGLASYYSTFFNGRKTANGEVFHNRSFSAAHLTLPLGSWVEVKARATGKKLRMRVNDRGPYAKKFMLDLSQAAARFLGVDIAPDRYVDVRIIALPGEEPLPEEEENVAAGFSPNGLQSSIPSLRMR